MVIGQKRHPGETPVTLRVLCVSPGIKNEKIGVGFAKDVHADSGNNLAHRQANAVSLLHSICLPVAVSTFVVKIGNFNCR